MAREPRLPALFGGSGSRRRRALSALRGVAGRTAATLPTAQVLEALAVRASDAVDDLASRLLAEDEAAAQLAYLVELATAAHGQEAVLAVVLRRNLWLNGTFLKMSEPMLRGREEVVFDAETLAAGRLTLLHLLVRWCGFGVASAWFGRLGRGMGVCAWFRRIFLLYMFTIVRVLDGCVCLGVVWALFGRVFLLYISL